MEPHVPTDPRWLLDALRRDPDLRDELVALLGDGVATKADIAAIHRRLDHHARILERHSDAIERLVRAVEEQGKRIEEQGKRIEEQGKRIEEQGRRIEVAFLHVDALGARWGLKSEAAFRDGLRRVLAGRFGARVERWEQDDTEGVVFGHPSSVEIDVVVQDGQRLLVEIKSHVSRGDVAAFQRKAALYERLTGTAGAARLIVSPSFDEAARRLAQRMGIEVSTDLTSGSGIE